MDFLDRMRTRAQARARGSYLGERTGKSLCFSQHDMNAANGSGATVRADYNNALVALATVSSGATEPSTTFAYQPWADTTNSLLKQRNAANTAWLVRGTLAESFILARSSNTIVGISNFGQVLNCTSTFTQTLTAAATLGDGFYFSIKNSGSGIITIDPNSTETIDGATTITVQPGEGFIVWCNGSGFVTIGRANVSGLTEDTAPDLDADYVMVYDASASGLKKVKLGRLGGGVLGTAVATTSGTAIDFTGIPSWVKRVKVQFSGVSTSGTSRPILQIGDSGGIEASGYLGSGGIAGTTFSNETTGMAMTGSWAAIHTFHGIGVLELLDASTNKWAWSFQAGLSSGNSIIGGASSKALSATLDRIRLTTVGGTDTFDAGSMNIHYE